VGRHAGSGHRWTSLLGAALAALALAGCPAHPATRSGLVDDGIVIEDVTVVSPERAAPLAHADVVVRAGRIAQVVTERVAGPHARRIDGRGRFLMPGLIDSHVHLGHPAMLDDAVLDAHPELRAAYRARLPRTYLAFGFTALVDLDLSADTRAWFEAAPLHPDLFHCGRAVRIAGGYGAQRIPTDPARAAAVNLVYEPGQAERWPAALDPGDYTPARAVERVAAAGGVCVKTFLEPGFGGAFHWPVPRAETLAALRDEAHRRRLVLVIHANAVESWRAAIDARADVIAHGLWHWPGDAMVAAPPVEADRAIAAAARAGVGVQPTLQAVFGDQSIFDAAILDDRRLADALPGSVLAYLHGAEAQAARRAVADEYRRAIAELYPGQPDPARAMSIAPARATATLRRMLAHGVRLLLGSDTPSNEGIGNPPGLNGRLEIQRWFEAGAPPATILRAATLDNAAAFGLADQLGSIEVGKRANLLLVRANPLDTVAAYDAIEIVFSNGTPIDRSALVAPD
jgi:imidazolonepropionase-like amidohydrolase